MQPTPSPAPDSTPNPVVEFIRSDRQTAGFVLVGLSALLLAVCGWAVYKSSRPDAPPPEPDAQKKADDPFSTLDEAPVKPKDPARYDYLVGGVLAAAGFLTAAGAGLWLLVSIPPLTEARQRANARALILAVGGLLGALLILAGIWFFYRWSAALADWLEKDRYKEARWVLYPLLMIVGGAGSMFLSGFPARAEERNNSTLRKLVYGNNMGLSVLLLFVVLVVFNLLVGPRLPNKLDTTNTGFYSLSAGSKEFLGRLDQPVTAYTILSESRSTSEDIRRLLENCRDASNGKIQVKSISPVANKADYRELAAKYPLLEANDTGVLLTFGEDEKRHAFIRDDEFVQRDAAPAPGGDSGRSFVGEARLMRELLFLGESEKKAVVYFTQQAGEPALDPAPGDEVNAGATLARLKAFLERNYLDVRALRFDPAAPKVPDDAAVVVVAEPQSPLAEAHVAALRQYMTEARGGKKGKLIVLAGARFSGPKDKVSPTGLEGLLAEFNVRLWDRVVLSEPSREMDLPPEFPAVLFTPNAKKARHPVAVALGDKAAFFAPYWRPVTAAQAGGGASPFRTLPLLMTSPGRYSWLEDERPREVGRVYQEVMSNAQVRTLKQFSDGPRPVGAVVTEGESGRVAVYGNGLFVTDSAVGPGRDALDPPAFDLVGGTIDWLRDRPTLKFDSEAKKYKMFILPATADETRGLLFPLLFALMAVTGMGVSVWMIRRRAA